MPDSLFDSANSYKFLKLNYKLYTVHRLNLFGRKSVTGRMERQRVKRIQLFGGFSNLMGKNYPIASGEVFGMDQDVAVKLDGPIGV